jgi:glycosyltransferase involved in cell wall biosynthesis
LAAAIEKVMANPTLAARYGREGRARALELFSAEAFIGNYRAVFRAVARCGPDSNN